MIWNLQRLTNKDVPQFDPLQCALARGVVELAKLEKTDDIHVVMEAAVLDSAFPSVLSTAMQVNPCQAHALKYDRSACAMHPVLVDQGGLGEVRPGPTARSDTGAARVHER